MFKYYKEAVTSIQQIQRATKRPEINGTPNNIYGNLKLKKIINLSPVEIATDENSGPNQKLALCLSGFLCQFIQGH